MSVVVVTSICKQGIISLLSNTQFGTFVPIIQLGNSLDLIVMDDAFFSITFIIWAKCCEFQVWHWIMFWSIHVIINVIPNTKNHWYSCIQRSDAMWSKCEQLPVIHYVLILVNCFVIWFMNTFVCNRNIHITDIKKRNDQEYVK